MHCILLHLCVLQVLKSANQVLEPKESINVLKHEEWRGSSRATRSKYGFEGASIAAGNVRRKNVTAVEVSTR